MKNPPVAGLVALSLFRTVALSAADLPAMKDDAPIVAFVGARSGGPVPRGDSIPKEMEAAASEASVPKEDAQLFRADITKYVHYMGFGPRGFNNGEQTFNLPAGVLKAERMLEKIGAPDAVEISWQKNGKPVRKIKRLFYDRTVFQMDANETVESLRVNERYWIGLNYAKLSPAEGYEKVLKRPSAKWGTVEKLMDKLLKETPPTQKELRQQLGDWWKTKTTQTDRRSLVYTCDDGLLIVVVDPTGATRK